MTIVFFGASDRSAPILESLNSNFSLKLCITKDDVVVGRHQTTKETGVKSWAKQNGITFYPIKTNLKDEAEIVTEHIKSTGAELGVVADFGFIVPESILAAFPKGLINVHFSLLPKYRGASPVQHTILNGDQLTGITYQLMEKSLDTGPVLHQTEYKFNFTETSGELYTTLFALAAKELPKVIVDYTSGKLTPRKQNESEVSYTYSPTHPKTTYIYKEDARISWNKPVGDIERELRAYNPWPISWTSLNELVAAGTKVAGLTNLKRSADAIKTVKIYSAQPVEGKLHIERIQVEGGKVLTWQEFANGYLV